MRNFYLQIGIKRHLVQLGVGLETTGTCQVRNEIETKPNETKPKSKLNETKNQNQNEIKNVSFRISDYMYLDI
jgi:hypothetical protein